MALGDRTQVPARVDAVRSEYGFIVKIFLSDPDPAQLVTDQFYLFFSALHKNSVSLAGDTIKRCINSAGFSDLTKQGWTGRVHPAKNR